MRLPIRFAPCSMHYTEKWRGFRLGWLSAIVQSVRAHGTTCAMFAVAIFTIALLCSSVCSAACAMELCPNLGQHARQTDSHDCEHAAQKPFNGSHQRGPQTPVCSGHLHPTFEAVKSDGALQFQLRATARAHVSPFSLAIARNEQFVLAASSSDPAPPQLSEELLIHEITVLRI